MMNANDPQSEPSGQALPAGTRIEEFAIERLLGSGGFGITYLARDTRLNRQVVIKENLPVQFCFRDTHSLTVAPRHSHGDDAENFRWSLENFSREAALLASVDHPGIVRVHRSFEAFGTAYFVMPFVEGADFGSLIEDRRRRGRPFTEEELGGLLERMLDALSHLHARGIYHRDIKPGNILITNEGVPVLIDFGSARQRLSERSMTVIESPGYTPFEQLQSRGNVGPWSDLYALGGTLCKALTNEAPPKAMDRMRRDPFVPLASRPELTERYSAGFLGGIDKSLEVEEGDRWQDAGEWQVAVRKAPTESTDVGWSFSDVSAISTPVELENRPAIQTTSIPSGRPGGGNYKRDRLIALAILLGALVFWVASVFDWKEPGTVRSERANELQARQPETALAEAQEERLAAEEAAQAKARAEESAQAKERAEEAVQKMEIGSRPGEDRNFEIAPGVSVKMCWIPAGEFLMGSPTNELGHSASEAQHRVAFTRGFWLGKYEVTQAQWEAVMGSNPSQFKGANLPVESVSWNDIARSKGFLENANRFAAAGGRFHLPTEAQWEYACRAGTTTALNSGRSLTSARDACPNLDEVAWYASNSASETHQVGLKKANAWGLHDMHGNLWEWCADWHGDYPKGTASDPTGPNTGSCRVLRGGSWGGYADFCRAANRFNYNPSDFGNYFIGFRLARSSVP